MTQGLREVDPLTSRQVGFPSLRKLPEESLTARCTVAEPRGSRSSKKPRTSPAKTAESIRPIASTSAPRVRASALRGVSFASKKASFVGLWSGE